ncbi:hypothetical protein N7535_005635 [Penicillium sp. DV-2018c]|nr:hypothetical protein N7461_009209 [Penicillium sp. DV-2018c]KAJ5571975.1 hypothetical protein N7535_005635 [Penicillium sp. DV-2018c]
MILTRQSFIRSFIVSVLVVSVISSKLLHLFQHASSLPWSHLALYFPTFFILETLLCLAIWGLLFKLTGFKSLLGLIFSVATTFLSFVLSSSQIGFWFVTGSEIRWDAATTVGNDPEGRKLMLSGLRSFLGAAALLLVVSWLLKFWTCLLINNWMSAFFSAPATEKIDEENHLAGSEGKSQVTRLTRIWTVCAVVVVAVLRLTRPQVPYNHMSGAIPFSFFQALGSKPAEQHRSGDHAFPLANLIDEPYWEGPYDHFKGWAPGKPDYSAKSNRPAWASKSLPPGFERWTERKIDGEASKGSVSNAQNKTSQRNYYSSVDDPLRITNLNHELLEPIARALRDHKVPITHVVLVLMESARKDIFPFKAGSHLHEEILSSYSTPDRDVLRNLTAKLSNLTPNAEKLTGEASGFPLSNDSSSISARGLDNPAEPEMGGINVNGILTGSSLSFKSAVINYCGAAPIPVNFMDEVKAQIYQPCIMQIFELFNQLKGDFTAESAESTRSRTGLEHMPERNWSSVFMQSITGLYDDQNILNTNMGFKQSIYREDIGHDGAKYYHKDMEEINYFGYPEYEIRPYLRDVVNNVIQKKERLFLSHFTSTTHHPWGTPSDYPEEQYFADDGLVSKHEDMNKYLNSVRYVDTWLGDMMKVFDEAGIANETLTVFIGDQYVAPVYHILLHKLTQSSGQAFSEDSPVSGTYENGHISNFRIPLLFHHPLLPKLQITANATSISVIPTILDLLVNSGSLNDLDSEVALGLMNEYEGQSLLRPYQATHNGRQAWNFGIINPGGTMLSIGSAAVPYRLILPLTEDFEYVFSDLDADPNELSPLRGWSLEQLIGRVQSKHGDKAAKWLSDAEKVGKWWIGEQKRLWNYQ